MAAPRIQAAYSASWRQKGRLVNKNQGYWLLREITFVHHSGPTKSQNRTWVVFCTKICSNRAVVLDHFPNVKLDFNRSIHVYHVRRHHLWQAGWSQSCKLGHPRFILLTLTSFIALLISRKMILIRGVTLGQWFESSSKHPTFPMEP